MRSLKGTRVHRFFFFFSSRRRHTRSDRDWSSDVCSSDLLNSDGGGNVRPSASRASIVASGIAPPWWLAARGQAICDTGHTTAPENPDRGLSLDRKSVV